MKNRTKDISSVRIYIENGFIKIDIRVKSNTKLPKGKKGTRFRFSTGEKDTPSNIKSIEKNKFKLAEEYLDSLYDTLENKEEVLFGDIAELALKEAEADRRKDDGTKDYFNILINEVYPTFKDIPLKEIRPKDIKAWQVHIGEQNISQSRFNKKHYVLKRVLDYALENEYIQSNPISLVKRSSKLFKRSEDNNSEYFSKEEMNQILNSKCESTNLEDIRKHEFIITYLYVAFYTGARVGEIMSLKFSEVDFTNNTITFKSSIRKGILSTTKTGRERTVPMVEKLSKALLKWKGTSANEFVFTKPYSKNIYKDSKSIVDIYYKPLLKNLNLPFRILYSTRHTFASLAIENGIPISTVSQCLGHQDTVVTSRYYLKYGQSDQNAVRNQLEGLTA